MNANKNFNKIPASACTLVVGDFELGDNGDNAKSAPMRLVARSGKAIEHPFWGRIVHDLAGMKTHKPRLPIDYVHDSKEVIGYLNKFDISSGDLVASGALVPFKDNDRATEIVHKSKQGVPYEASINFGGDGIKIEEVPEGFVTMVNGYELSGPAVVVREWPLRGVAICPYGADMNTDSRTFGDGKEYAAEVITAKPTNTTEEVQMNQDPVDVVAEVEAPEAAETATIETPVETPVTEAVELDAPAVEAAPSEGEQGAEQPTETPETAPPVEQPNELSRTDFLAILDEFGAEIAAETVRGNGSYLSALKLAYQKQKEATAAALQNRVETLATSTNGQPAPVVDGKPKKGLLTLCEQGANSNKQG